MASIYVPVRLIMLVVSAVLFILNLIDFVEMLKAHSSDKLYLAVEGIIVVTILIGVWGSYKHDRNFLLTCALVLFINIIVGIFANNFPFISVGGSVLLIVLAVLQAELMRRGYQ